MKAALACFVDDSFANLKLIMRDAGKLTSDIYDAAALPQLPPAWPAISLYTNVISLSKWSLCGVSPDPVW